MGQKRLPKITVPARPSAARFAGDDYGARDEPDWTTVDWREHLRSIELAAGRVNYVELGSGAGRPIVFVHGIAGNWQNWLENLPRFAQERRVLALDLPGFGASDDLSDEPSMSGYGQAVEEFCDRLELGPVALVGNSMGGFIAAETTIQFPERVERLVLVSSAGMTTSELRQEPILAASRALAMGGARSAAEIRMAVTRPRLRHAIFSVIVRHPSRIRPDILFEISRGAGRDAFVPVMKAILEYDFRERLPDIRCPTLIVWGEKDAIIPAGDAYEYERLIPGTQPVVMMEDTGHIPMVERPRTFNDEVFEFLAGPPPQQGIADETGEPAAASA
jgi:pimeloyl-ACP methyl ester carboxylesterase